jgi:hypothetical protein
MARSRASSEKSGLRATFRHRLLAPGAELGGPRHLARHVMRDHHGAVAVGVDQVVRAHDHAEHVDRAAERDRVHPGVRWRDLAAHHLELGGHGVQVAHAAVGDQALAAEGFVDRGLHLAPEAAKANSRIDVLDDHDLRPAAGRNVAVGFEPRLAVLRSRPSNGSVATAQRSSLVIFDP